MKQQIVAPVTGRAYMCVGIHIDEEDFVKDSFKIGDVYLEVHHDEDDNNYCDEQQLLLICKDGHCMYVNKSDFALMLDMSNVVLEIIDAVNG